MTAWILYSAVVSGVVTLAASVLERAARGRGRPSRGIWTGALALSLAIPAVAAIRSGSAVAGGTADLQAVTEAAVPAGEPVLRVPVAPWWERIPEPARAWEAWLLPLWAAASLGAGGILLLSTGMLRRRARRWPLVRLPGGEALLSERFGPALIAGIPARVVIPRWVLGLGRAGLEMVQAHEEEHRRAGDANLLLAGAGAVAVAPWNPLMWIQLRRLRAAVELDCDARVLGRGYSPTAYAGLLFELGGRSRTPRAPWAVLAAEPSLLERRLTMIVRGRRSMGGRRTAGAVLVAGILVGTACGLDAPPLSPEADAEEKAAFAAQEAATLAAEKKRWLASGAADQMAGKVIQGLGRVLIFVDGEPVTAEEMASIDKSAIERVEILKGPAAVAAFGDGAAEGAIQIFLKDREESPGAGSGAGR